MLMILIFGLSFVMETQGKDGCRDLEYLTCIENKTLAGHVINTFRILPPGLENCQNKCYHDNRCVSYNLGPVNGVTRWCELNAADHSSRPTFLVNKTGHEYCPIKNPCLSNPCSARRFCSPDFDWDTFNCDDGAWTQWGIWTEVFERKPRTKKRTRSCTSPAPQNSGSSCDGPAKETKPCKSLPIVSTTGCSSPLGMEDGRINDSHITASSFAFSDPMYKPRNGRLNEKKVKGVGYGVWAAGSKDAGDYIQIDLESTKVITMVATQGREQDNIQWVTKYSLSYSDDGKNWKNYGGDCVKIFPGNADRNTIVTNKLQIPIKARYIRLTVLGFYGWPAMRMELYGCSHLNK